MSENTFKGANKDKWVHSVKVSRSNPRTVKVEVASTDGQVLTRRVYRHNAGTSVKKAK